MAKRTQQDTQFKPGHPGGPGRPPNPGLSVLTKTELKTLVNKIIQAKPDELKTFQGNILEMTIASALKKGIERGDMDSLNQLLDRIVGKPKEVIESHVFDESKSKRIDNARKILFDIIAEKKDLEPVYIESRGLLKEPDESK